jgi:hypothetical protein
VSYPYATSGPLHTYAGLLAFYLAQPESARLTNLQANASTSPDPDSPPSSTKRPKNQFLASRSRLGLGASFGLLVDEGGESGSGEVDALAWRLVNLIDQEAERSAQPESAA